MTTPEEEVSYRTLAGEGHSEFIVEKSRFIGYAFGVRQLPDMMAQVESIRKEHHAARHVCYGARIGRGVNLVERFNDDAEPSRTAGFPLWQLLDTGEITDALLVVVRYFGGIKLGTGGLSRAYRDCGRAALDAAGVVVVHPQVSWTLPIPYRLLDLLEHRLATVESLEILQKDFRDTVLTTFSVRTSFLPEARCLLQEVLQIAPDFAVESL